MVPAVVADTASAEGAADMEVRTSAAEEAMHDTGPDAVVAMFASASLALQLV